jgi:carbamoyltransferase
VSHFGTARLQTMRESGTRASTACSRWGEASGTPVLLNTSFNLRGEPIRRRRKTPSTFERSGLDLLVLGDVPSPRPDQTRT